MNPLIRNNDDDDDLVPVGIRRKPRVGRVKNEIDRINEKSRIQEIAPNSHQLQIFESINPELHVAEDANEWELIEVIVDSGASSSVLPIGMCTNYELQESPGSKCGQCFAGANGDPIHNTGERVLYIVTDEGHHKKLTMQVCDVRKPLLSASSCNANGTFVVLDGPESYMQNKRTGEKSKIHQNNGVYCIYMWVKPFTRQGR